MDATIERLCLREASHLLRSPKYYLMLAKFYLESLCDPETAQLFRASYFFARHIDDVLDGDLPDVTQNPELYTRRILKAMDQPLNGHADPPSNGQTHGPLEPDIMHLYRFALPRLNALARPGDDPEQQFKRVILKGMLFDYDRSKTRRILTQHELETYFDDTFTPVTDLALMIAGSPLRCRDLPEAVLTQGHLFSIRDLDRDLKQGIINIPQEVLAEAKLELFRDITQKGVESHPILSQWMDREVATYHSLLARWEARIQDDPAARKVCSPLILQMDLFCKLYDLRKSLKGYFGPVTKQPNK